MENLSSCDLEVLSEVPYSDSYPNDMINQEVQEMQYSEQTHIDDFQDNKIHKTLILEEESRSKMLDKQNDPISIEKKIKISPIDYSKLNKIKEDFEVEAPSELPSKCQELETELLKKKDFIEKEAYDKLSQEKDTVIRKLKDRIKSLNGKDSLENVKKDIDEIETINIELEHSVAKLLSENENLSKEQEHLKLIYKDQFDSIRKTRVQSKEHCDSLIAQINTKSLENSNLNAQIQEKVFANAALKNELRKLKGKNVVNIAVSKPNATIVLGMFKLDIEPISPRLKNNRDAHETDSLKTKDSNKPLLNSTGVKPTTSASGSKPSGNTKNNRITRPPSSNQKNKVEDHSRKVKSSLNKMNSVSKPVSNALVKHSMRNAKFESICAICNKCLFDANHDMCIIDYVNDVNKPTGRTFTIVGNRCPLTRITSNKIVPPKVTTIAPVVTPTSGILVYSRRPKATRSVGSSSKVGQIVPKYLDFGCSKHMTENRSQLINFVSKFLSTVRFGNDHIAKIIGYGDYQMGNVTISWVYYVEGLDGVDLLKGSQGSNLYTLSMDNLLLSSPICLLSKASKSKSWLWNQRLSHLNFDYINSLAKHGLVRGLPKLKY
ncbi:integrase, catalytic region, zinc finger, CCHC-type containing protein [Tanacetum coccineum]